MNYDQILLLGTVKLKFKTMTIEDSDGFVNLKDPIYQLPTNFYGNQVVNLAKTIYPGIYLCVDKYKKPFDILVKKDEIAELDPSEIRAILEAKNIAHSKQLPKKHLLSLLGIDYDKPEEPDPNAGTGGYPVDPVTGDNNGQPKE